MLQLSLADKCCKALHVPLAIQSAPCAYNVSSQLVSTEGTFKESWSARKITQVSIADSKSIPA